MANGSPSFRRWTRSRDVGRGGVIGAKKRRQRRQPYRVVSANALGVGDGESWPRGLSERVAWCGVLELFLQSRTSLSIESSGDATGRADAGKWLPQDAAFAASREVRLPRAGCTGRASCHLCQRGRGDATVLANAGTIGGDGSADRLCDFTLTRWPCIKPHDQS
jgi:hypothetical protein